MLREAFSEYSRICKEYFQEILAAYRIWRRTRYVNDFLGSRPIPGLVSVASGQEQAAKSAAVCQRPLAMCTACRPRAQAPLLFFLYGVQAIYSLIGLDVAI